MLSFGKWKMGICLLIGDHHKKNTCPNVALITRLKSNFFQMIKIFIKKNMIAFSCFPTCIKTTYRVAHLKKSQTFARSASLHERKEKDDLPELGTWNWNLLLPILRLSAC